jgi:hypothetical protein
MNQQQNVEQRGLDIPWIERDERNQIQAFPSRLSLQDKTWLKIF